MSYVEMLEVKENKTHKCLHLKKKNPRRSSSKNIPLEITYILMTRNVRSTYRLWVFVPPAALSGDPAEKRKGIKRREEANSTQSRPNPPPRALGLYALIYNTYAVRAATGWR